MSTWEETGRRSLKIIHSSTYNLSTPSLNKRNFKIKLIYRAFPLRLTALQYVCTSSLCTLTKKNSNPLQQTPASALAGNNTDAVELISIDCEHCSLLGANRPRNFKENIFSMVNTPYSKMAVNLVFFCLLEN